VIRENDPDFELDTFKIGKNHKLLLGSIDLENQSLWTRLIKFWNRFLWLKFLLVGVVGVVGWSSVLPILTPWGTVSVGVGLSD